jgi:hypothetical protein
MHFENAVAFAETFSSIMRHGPDDLEVANIEQVCGQELDVIQIACRTGHSSSPELAAGSVPITAAIGVPKIDSEPAVDVSMREKLAAWHPAPVRVQSLSSQLRANPASRYFVASLKPSTRRRGSGNLLWKSRAGRSGPASDSGPDGPTDRALAAW